jgi:hypothetical protein
MYFELDPPLVVFFASFVVFATLLAVAVALRGRRALVPGYVGGQLAIFILFAVVRWPWTGLTPSLLGYGALSFAAMWAVAGGLGALIGGGVRLLVKRRMSA